MLIPEFLVQGKESEKLTAKKRKNDFNEHIRHNFAFGKSCVKIPFDIGDHSFCSHYPEQNKNPSSAGTNHCRCNNWPKWV